MLQVDIPKETTFDLPEGCFKAQVSDVRQSVKQTSKGAQDWVRLLFQVEIPKLSERLDTMAGRSFKLELHPGTDLRNFLVGLLGQKFFTDHSGQQIDLEALRNTECEVQLEHHWGKDYEKPLVVVARVAPPGTLKLSPTTPAKPKEGKNEIH